MHFCLFNNIKNIDTHSWKKADQKRETEIIHRMPVVISLLSSFVRCCKECIHTHTTDQISSAKNVFLIEKRTRRKKLVYYFLSDDSAAANLIITRRCLPSFESTYSFYTQFCPHLKEAIFLWRAGGGAGGAVSFTEMWRMQKMRKIDK